MAVLVNRGYSNELRVEEATNITVTDGHLLLGRTEAGSYVSVAAIAPGKWDKAEVLPEDEPKS